MHDEGRQSAPSRPRVVEERALRTGRSASAPLAEAQRSLQAEVAGAALAADRARARARAAARYRAVAWGLAQRAHRRAAREAAAEGRAA